MKKDKTSQVFMYCLGALIVLGFFGVLFALITKSVPENNNDTLNIVLGSLMAAFAGVVGYFYGSSQGSKDKTELLSTKDHPEKPTKP